MRLAIVFLPQWQKDASTGGHDTPQITITATEPLCRKRLHPPLEHLVRVDAMFPCHQRNRRSACTARTGRLPLKDVSVVSRRPRNDAYNYSTVTDFAKFLGWSTSQPRRTAMW
jgi:hypothetical protein